MICKEYYDVNKHWKVGDIVWACAFKYAGTKESKHLYQTPIKGMFTHSKCPEDIKDLRTTKQYKHIRYFIPFKKNGKDLAYSKAVNYNARCYADYEYECINLYNELIQKNIDWHKSCIKDLCDLLIGDTRKKPPFESMLYDLKNGATFEQFCKNNHYENVECIGNIAYEDEDLYEFLKKLDAEIVTTVYDRNKMGYAIIHASGVPYHIPIMDIPNRFDDTYPDETLFIFKSIIDAEYTSVWDDNIEITTNCKVNLLTAEVFNIEPCKTDIINGLNTVTDEYVTLFSDKKYTVSRYGEEDEPTDFWYK